MMDYQHFPHRRILNPIDFDDVEMLFIEHDSDLSQVPTLKHNLEELVKKPSLMYTEELQKIK